MSADEIASSLPLPRSVRRAIDAMRANAGHDWRVAELASVAGVSSRTLQRQFMNFVGRSPRALLRELGFDRARRELLRATSRTRITDVALRCGFSHFGRFAVEYRRRYGETPSQTVKRQASFAAMQEASPAARLRSHEQPLLAFADIQAGTDNREAASAIADDLMTALTRSGIAVTSQSASAPYQLVGTLRGTGAEAQLSLRLVDGQTGRSLWAQRCESVPDARTAADEHLATRIAAALQPQLRLAEIDRALRKPAGDLGAHDLALRAMPGVVALDADGNARAIELLARAMDRDPTHALATALAAWAHVQRVVYYFSSDPPADRARGLELARKARALGGDATVLAVLGNALTLLDEVDDADIVIRKALAADGGSVWAWSRSGWIDVYRGNSDAAIERFKIALDLAPHDELAFNSMVGMGCAYFHAGNYAQAARWQARALAEHPSAIWAHRTLCPAYVLGGAREEAGRSLIALRRQYPDLTIAEVQVGLPPLPRPYCERLLEGLHEAGLPD